MNSGKISIDRVLNKLDSYFHKNDYQTALKHLKYWLDESKNASDKRAQLLITNEMMGLYRKQGMENEAVDCANNALDLINEMRINNNIGAATTFLNCATVYKAFNKTKSSLILFEKAKSIYEEQLSSTDSRLAGLYNNFALALVDAHEYERAIELYDKALCVLGAIDGSEPEQAITWLNKASAAQAEKGIEDASELIEVYLEKARTLLDNSFNEVDGNYAFVCEKCAGVFGYYGYFLYQKELEERARVIYERS